MLRSLFLQNNANRSRAVVYGLFRKQYPSSINKPVLVERILEDIAERAKNCPIEIARLIGDIGVVQEEEDGLRSGEAVFLRTNSTSASGDPCVVACGNFVGVGVSGSENGFIRRNTGTFYHMGKTF